MNVSQCVSSRIVTSQLQAWKRLLDNDSGAGCGHLELAVDNLAKNDAFVLLYLTALNRRCCGKNND